MDDDDRSDISDLIDDDSDIVVSSCPPGIRLPQKSVALGKATFLRDLEDSDNDEPPVKKRIVLPSTPYVAPDSDASDSDEEVVFLGVSKNGVDYPDGEEVPDVPKLSQESRTPAVGVTAVAPSNKGKEYRSRVFAITLWMPENTFSIVNGKCVPDPAFVCGEGKRVPNILKRACLQMFGYRCGGQYEACPTTQKMHFQGFFVLFSARVGGLDKKTTLRSCRQKFLDAVRYDDGPSGTKVDGLVLKDAKENWHISIKHEKSSMNDLEIYCTREDKRLFGNAVFWCVTGKEINESVLNQKATLTQVGEMLISGHEPLDIVRAAPALGTQYFRTINEVCRGFKEEANKKLAKKPRCTNKWCRMHHVNDDITNYIATQLGKSRNEVLELMAKPCEMRCEYFFGAPRTGKSTTTMMLAESTTPGSVYLKPSKSQFWGAGETAYNGELSVVIHDCTHEVFAGLSDFKRVVDCQAHKLDVKNSETLLIARNFFIDSQMCPLQLLLDLCNGKLCSQDDYYAYSKRFTNVYEYRKSTDGYQTVTCLTFPRYGDYRDAVLKRSGGPIRVIYPLNLETTAIDNHRAMVNLMEKYRAQEFCKNLEDDK